MRPCPYCAEEIQDAAIKCRHCGSMLVGGSPPPAVRGPAPVVRTRGSGVLFKALGTLGCIAGVLMLIAGSAFGAAPLIVGFVLFVVGRFYD